MAGVVINSHRVSMTNQITETVREWIASGEYKPGDALPPIKTLSQRFGVSLTPVNQAFQRLEDEGLIVCRVGAGSFVTDLRPISNPLWFLLCANIARHIYGDVASKIVQQLHNLRVYPVLVDTQSSDCGADLLQNAVPQARVILIIGSAGFPFQALREQALKGKIVVGVLAWENETDGFADPIHQILVDHREGARLVAEHLWGRGCRRVVVLGTSTMVDEQEQVVCPFSGWGKPFEEFWLARGGSLRVLASRFMNGSADPLVDREAFLSLLAEEQEKGVTGVFGLRDFEARQAQDFMLDNPERRFDAVPVVGYGNTPWSQAARPPITTVDWNIEELANITSGVIQRAVVGTLGAPERFQVRPLLIVRS